MYVHSSEVGSFGKGCLTSGKVLGPNVIMIKGDANEYTIHSNE